MKFTADQSQLPLHGAAEFSATRNTGLMISFGTDNPFEPDDPIIGGANKQITMKADTPGCYKYDG